MMENVDVRRDAETYCNLMNSYLLAQVAELDAVLQQNGVSDVGLRENICAQFNMSLGQILDMGWIGAEGKRFHPLLMFSEKYLTDPDTPLAEVSPLEGPSREDEFHALAVDAVTVFYEDLAGKSSEVSYGAVDDEV